ncbi:carbon-nitrogen hydrolase family protein [Lysobacter sp. N42]|nr:carbon-nitrogen hydrolase family protein [Aliidiomarina sp. B3213]TCZ91787.1 carbon-nitrogen hydrolase family protein [Lysobacter sp. N42]
MANKPCITLLQWTSLASWQDNQQKLMEFIEKLPECRPQLVILPEMFAQFGAGEKRQGALAEPYGNGPIQTWLAEVAKQHNIWILAGTMPIQAGERYAAASILFNAQGEQVTRYDKIHLFDASVDDGTKTYQESKFTRPGNEITVIETPWGSLGLAVCYDLRFPGMFQALRQQGADIITLPSAFTKVTGNAHWEALIRARAIENQVYMLAPNQTGKHADNRETWGHSMVVDPWGSVVEQLGSEEGMLTVELDLEPVRSIREKMPVVQHNRFEVNFVEYAPASK